MDESVARYLTSPAGEALLARVAALPGDAAARVLALRGRERDLAPEVAAAAVDVAEARKRAARRYPDADRLFFTPDALAQATSSLLAAYHARVLAPPGGEVADLCCGVGMDALAFAEAGARVTAVDLDPARLAFAEANARVRGVGDRIRFVRGDATSLDPGEIRGAVFLDPARRTAPEGGGSSGGRRVSARGEQYSPPLSFAADLAGRVGVLGVKLSPALPDEALYAFGGAVHFLSEARECKEAFVLCGSDVAPTVSALLLPQGIELAGGEGAPTAPVGPVGAYLLDPDPAVLRAGALGALCASLERVGARRVSHDDGYLTADAAPAETRPASVYRVIEAMPYRARAVGEWLRARGVGRLVVKKRRFPKEPDAVARELKLSGRGDEMTLVLVQDGRSDFLAVLCEPAASAPAAAAAASPA